MLEPANLVAAYLLAPDATIIVQPPENLGAGPSRQSPPRDASRPIPPDEQFGAAVLPSGTRRCCVRSEQNLTHLHQVLKLKDLVAATAPLAAWSFLSARPGPDSQTCGVRCHTPSQA